MYPIRPLPSAAVLAVCGFLIASNATATASIPPLSWTKPSASNIYWYSGASDKTGNVIAAGWITVAAQNDWIVRKHDSSGAVLWEDVYAGAANGEDAALTVCTDDAGNVIAGGRTTVSGQAENYMLRKYAPNGAVLWTKTYNAPANNLDEIWGVAADSNGDIVIGAQIDRTDVGQATDWLVAKYAGADGTLLWSRTYDSKQGTGNNDGCYTVIADASRNVYAAGFASANTNLSTHYIIIKYDPNGNVLWTRTCPGRPGSTDARIERVALDQSGNLYAGGHDIVKPWPDYDWLISKYDPAGNIVWTRTWNGPGSSTDYVRAAMFLSDGTLVAAGFHTGATTSRDWLLRAYDQAGLLLWSFTLGGSSSDELNGIGVDACDSIYLLGKYGTGSRLDRYSDVASCSAAPSIAVVKTVSPTNPGPGVPVTYTIQVTNTGTSSAFTLMAVDTLPPGVSFGSQSNTAGMTWNGNTSIMAWTGAVTLPTGNSVTITINGTTSTCYTGNVCNTAWARASNGPGSTEASTFTCFPLLAPVTAPSCGWPAVVWSRSHNGPTNSTDLVGRIAVDPSGNLIVGGHETGSGALNWLVRKYDPNGTVLWSKGFAGSSGGIDEVYDVATDGAGDVYVAGSEMVSGQNYNWRLHKYDPSGNLLWARTYNSPASDDDRAYGLAVDPSGNAYVVGFETRSDLGQGQNFLMIKYDAGGNQLWTTSYTSAGSLNDFAWDVNVDSAGNPASAITVAVGGVLGWLVRKFDPSGHVLWDAPYNSSGLTDAWSVAIDGSDNVIVTGSSSAAAGFLVRKYTGAGGFLWERTYGSAGGSAEAAVAAAADPAGNIIAAGYESRPDLGQDSNWLIRKYDAGGTLLWSLTASMSQPASGGDFVRGVAFAPDGAFYAAGANTIGGQSDNWLVRKFGDQCPGLPPPSVSVVKSVTPSNPGPGQPLTYRILVTNTGSVTITSLTVTDSMPANVAWVGQMTSPILAYNGSTTLPAWDGSLSLEPGWSATIVINSTVLPCASGVVSNTGWVQASSWTGSAQAASATVFTVASSVPAQTVVQTLTGGGGIGAPVTYTIVVTNTGSATIDSLTIVDTLSPVITAVTPSTPAGFTGPVIAQSVSGTIYSWSSTSPLLPGTAATFQLAGTVGYVCFPTAVSNTAWVTAATSCTSTKLISNQAGFAIAVPAMSFSAVKSIRAGSGTAIGSPIAYDLVITNTGGLALDSLTIVDTISPVIRNVTTTQPGFPAPVVSSVFSGTRYVWTAGGLNLLPGSSVTVSLDGQLGAVCTVTAVSNTAYVTARDIMNCAEKRGFSNGVGSVVVPAAPGLTVVQSRTPATPRAGDAVTYEIVVTNTGSATMDQVTVVETLPAVVAAVVPTQPGSFAAPLVQSVTGGTLFAWSAAASGLLPPGASLTFRLDGTIGLVCSPAAVAARAYAGGDAPCGSAAGFSGADLFTVAGSAPILAASVTVTPAAPSAGSALRYTVVITNTGSATAVDVVVSDTLPAGVAFTGQSATGGLVWNGSTTHPCWAGSINLEPGRSVTVLVDATASATYSGTVANTVWGLGAGGCGTGEASATATFTLSPPDEMGGARVKIVGGIRGYIQPKRGEQATILVRPTESGPITVRIYNLRGELVREISGTGIAGKTEVLHWNATDSAGADVPPGAYPVVIEAPGIRYKDTLAVLR